MIQGGNAHPARFIAAAAALLVALLACGCSLMAPSRDEVEQPAASMTVDASALVQEGVLTVALDTTDAPQCMVDAEGAMTGYYADVARALASKLGLHVAFVDAASASSSVGEGAADIFIGAKAADAGDELTVFGSCLEDAPSLFMLDADVQTASVAALSGKTVAVQTASAAQDALNKAGVAAEQLPCSNVNECFEAVASGQADCVACDATAGAYLASIYGDIAFAGTLDTTTVSGIAVSAGNSALTERVSSTFDSLSADGSLGAIHASWYGSLPLSLSDALLPGVELTEKDADEPESATSAAEDAAEQGMDLSDINEFDG